MGKDIKFCYCFFSVPYSKIFIQNPPICKEIILLKMKFETFMKDPKNEGFAKFECLDAGFETFTEATYAEDDLEISTYGRGRHKFNVLFCQKMFLLINYKQTFFSSQKLI